MIETASDGTHVELQAKYSSSEGMGGDDEVERLTGKGEGDERLRRTERFVSDNKK
jgi:hypothetical protein